MLRAIVYPNEKIIAVEVEAQGADHVDDIVIYRDDTTIYRQLKHKIGDSPRLLGSDLFGREKGKSTLIGKLYIGWRKVKKASSTPVQIRLTTNATGSLDSRNRPISPVEFDRSILSKARNKHWSPSTEEESILRSILTLTDAPNISTLRAFLADLYLDHGEPHETVLKQETVRLLGAYLRSSSQLEREAGAWAEAIYDLSTRHGETGKLTSNQIDWELRRILGHSQRVEHRLSLPKHHLAREKLCAQLLDKARALPEGYLVVEGPPGSGKTTLATWISNMHDDEVLLRYHAFDPQQASRIERGSRTSAFEFVSTILDVLASRFPSKIPRHAPAADRVHEAVSVIRGHLSTIATTKMRFVVVDGIDHAIRAGQPDSTLFDALPHPPPKGVVFILFGQPDWDYPNWIKRTRKLRVPPFTPDESRTLTCKSLGWSKENTQSAIVCDAVYEKTAGNPLSLLYSLRVLKSLGGNAESVAERLHEAALFGTSPHTEYESLLDDVETSLPKPHGSRSLRQEMLACVTIATAPVTESRLSTAFREDGLTKRHARDFLSGLGPVLAECGPGNYCLFHDDFRRYAEERTSPDQRSQAHCRFAMALEQDWAGSEVSALAEHYWLGREDERLADLPQTRSLEEWFTETTPRDTVTLHRLSLAAAFRLTDEVRIMRNLLAYARAHEAADLPWHASGLPEDAGLKPWAFVVPPAEYDLHSMERRSLALKAAANHYTSCPEQATEIARRFEVSLDALDDETGVHSHISNSYTQALTSWRMNSGDLPGTIELIKQGRFLDSTLKGVIHEFTTVKDPVQADLWTRALVGVHRSFDQGLIQIATEHLIDGQDTIARRIIDRVLDSPDINNNIRRNAAVLLSLLGGQLRKDQSFDCVSARMSNAYELIHSREVFFAGFATSAEGPHLSLNEAALPQEALLEYKLVARTEAITRTLWRAGNACGLVLRNCSLLTEHDLEELLRYLLPKASTPHQEYDQLRCGNFLLPLLARAVGKADILRARMSDYILSYVKSPLEVPSTCRHGYFEALWHLRPESWSALAHDTYSRITFPGFSAYERTQWCDYWLTHGQRRNITVPRSFVGLRQTVGLGVPRKTDPADLAVTLVCNDPKHPDTNIRLKSLTALLVQLSAEPEGGGRAALDHIPRVLSLAFNTSPRLFKALFLHVTGEDGFSEAFSTLPSEIASEILQQPDDLSGDELVTLWNWVTAAPGAVEDQDGFSKVKSIVANRLSSAGLNVDASLVQGWPTIPPPKSSRDQPGHSNREQPPPSETLIHNIDGVNLRWFSPWWDAFENRALRRHLDTGGDEAWRDVCSRMAKAIAQSREIRQYEALAAGSSLFDLRPNMERDRAISIALEHIAQKVRFQTAQDPIAPNNCEKNNCEKVDKIDILVGLIARGLEVGDARTVRYSLRSLAALARRPATRDAVLREMRSRLHTEDTRLLQASLLILRHAHMHRRLEIDITDQIRTLEDHPDAWSRYLACRIIGRSPIWPSPRSVSFGPGLVAPDVQPSGHGVGAAYYSGPTRVREVLVRKFREVVDVDEDTLRAWFETEVRALPERPSRWLGWDHSRGPSLSDGRISEAAGRLASRLASTAPPGSLPAILAVVVGLDPWLVLQPTEKEPPKGWIELCRTEVRNCDRHGTYTLRSLGVVDSRLLLPRDHPDYELLAKVAWLQLAPETPREFGWVAEPWPEISLPLPRNGPVAPFAMVNSIFGQFVRSQFGLIPALAHPAIQELSFQVRDEPNWVHSTIGPVIVPAFDERPASSAIRTHAPMDWWTGWYASPKWLNRLMQGQDSLSVVRFWRKSTRKKGDDEQVSEETIEYGIEEVDSPI